MSYIEQWMEAFHVYVAVYCQAHPLQTAALMKYAAIVQGIAKRSDMTAALFYDENFRTWQQHQPVVHWGVINSELYLQSSSVIGGFRSTLQGALSWPRWQHHVAVLGVHSDRFLYSREAVPIQPPVYLVWRPPSPQGMPV